jgi:ribosomal protein S18 acetylase RimI-like enzyme
MMFQTFYADPSQPLRVCYYKRYKMEVDLAAVPAPVLPPGFRFQAWLYDLVDAHAEVLFESFHQEVDAVVFASLSDRLGCATLITEISRRSGFAPEATWLLVGPSGPCGTVQGLRDRGGVGAIQNIGILPSLRGRGLGEALLLQSLAGFRRAGLRRGLLEVTAQNDGAIRLYRRLGFRRIKTLYKAVNDLRPITALA